MHSNDWELSFEFASTEEMRRQWRFHFSIEIQRHEKLTGLHLIQKIGTCRTESHMIFSIPLNFGPPVMKMDYTKWKKWKWMCLLNKTDCWKLATPLMVMIQRIKAICFDRFGFRWNWCWWYVFSVEMLGSCDIAILPLSLPHQFVWLPLAALFRCSPITVIVVSYMCVIDARPE